MLNMRRFPFRPTPSQVSVLFPKSEWVNRGNCWINLAEQGTEPWLHARKGKIPVKYLTNTSESPSNPSISTIQTVNARVTGSNYGAAAGRSRFSTRKDLALEIAGVKEKVFSEESKKNMAHGTKYELHARRWYEEHFGVEVEEIGLAVPKWNFHLGASVDGIVKGHKGIIEIKCPKQMYKPLKGHIKLREGGWTPTTKYYRSHIWPTHYDQMQGGMAILNMEWCDYIVYSTSDKEVYYERIPFNAKYWTEYLYPSLKIFLKEDLFPVLENILEGKDPKARDFTRYASHLKAEYDGNDVGQQLSTDEAYYEILQL